MARPKPGDIFEVPTPHGLAYAQFTQKYTGPPNWGDLVRALPGLHVRRPSDFAALAARKETLITFIPLASSLRQKAIALVGHADIPEHARSFPTFRQLDLLSGDNRITWSLWDGKREWQADELTREQQTLPKGPCVENIAALIDDILEREGHPSEERIELRRQQHEYFGRRAKECCDRGDFKSAINLYQFLLEGETRPEALQRKLDEARQQAGRHRGE